MPANPITNETSLENRPVLRWVLIAVWLAVVAYIVTILALTIAVRNVSVPAALLKPYRRE